MSNDKAIRDLAHKIWLTEGQPEGQSEQHWARAAAEVNKKNSKNNLNPKRSTDPSEANGPTEPEQPDQT